MAVLSRIQLRYDAYDQWAIADPVLLAGEIAVVSLTSSTDTMNDQPDTILFKIGDGKSKFSELGWTSSLAADVYDWAKAASRPVYTYGDTDLVGFGSAASHDAESTLTNSSNIPLSSAIVTYVAQQIAANNKGSVFIKKLQFDSVSQEISSFVIPKGINIQKLTLKVTGSTTANKPDTSTAVIYLKATDTVEKILVSTDDLDFTTIKSTSNLPETFIYDGLDYAVQASDGVHLVIDATSLQGLSGTLHITYNVD